MLSCVNLTGLLLNAIRFRCPSGAVAKARDLKPDLVVLDFAMPRLDGLKAAASISRDLPGTPIILHTMYGSTIPMEVGKYGVSRVVGKAETGALVRAVEELAKTSLA